MLKFPRACLTAAMFTMAAPAFAILPQTGMWSIGSELNGKPGRGIQIDRQGGELLILTYFGYRPDGSATFLQASGKLTDGALFSGELTEYKNGRAIGGEARDGEVAHVLGTVSIKFDSASSGTVTLPGEAPQRFSRYWFENHLGRLNGRFEYQATEYNSGRFSEARSFIRATLGQFSMTESGGRSCQYTGNLQPTGDSFSSKGTAVCRSGFIGPEPLIKLQYELLDIKVDENGIFTARRYLNLASEPHVTGRNGLMNHLIGTCALPKSDDWFMPTTSRCGPSDLNISPLTPSDFIP